MTPKANCWRAAAAPISSLRRRPDRLNPYIMPTFPNLGQLIDKDGDRSKVALIDLSGESHPRELSFAAIDEMANGVARALFARGLSRGDRVAILSANRAEYLASYFGIMRAGFITVPVNFKFPRDSIDFILRAAGAKFLFCDRARSSDAPDDLPRVQFGGSGPDGFDRFVDPGAFQAVAPRPRE